MSSKRLECSAKYTQLEEVNSYLIMENKFLKKRNEELAKALAETKVQYQKLSKDNLESHGRLYSIDVERSKFKKCTKEMSHDVQSFLTQFITLTEGMTFMLNKINTALQPYDISDEFPNTYAKTNSNTPNNHNKTVAVMPMISGHTILSPKINLPRVSVKQLTDMMNNNSDRNMSNDDIEEAEIEFADNEVSSNDEHSSTENSPIASETTNRRLETLLEEEEEEEEEAQRSIGSQSFLSGVFKDVKVYISPVTLQHPCDLTNKAGSRKLSNRNLNRTKKKYDENQISYEKSYEMSDYTGSDSNVKTQIQNTRKYSSVSANALSTTSAEDDPLEGSSNMWHISHNIDSSSTPIPNETSTPYSTKIEIENAKPKLEQSLTPNRSLKNITKRKGFNRRSRLLLSGLPNCSVRLQKISTDAIASYISNADVSPKKKSDESPASLKRYTKSNFGKSPQERKRVGSEFKESFSPNEIRSKRRVKPVFYKEPSLTKKLRRS